MSRATKWAIVELEIQILKRYQERTVFTFLSKSTWMAESRPPDPEGLH